MGIPSSPAWARCGFRGGAGGLFLCWGSAGSPSRGGEHPPRGRNFLHRDIFSETQSEWKGAEGRLASGGAAPCQEPLFLGPCTPKGHPVLRGDCRVTLGPATSLEEGQERRGVFASQPIAWLWSGDTADTERCCVWSNRSRSLLHP